ncbi:MAG: copper oxidase [Myxococcales bacterium]|nr:copper oxidase [Myxococcales bacterium]
MQEASGQAASVATAPSPGAARAGAPGGATTGAVATAAPPRIEPADERLPYIPVDTFGGATLPYRMVDGVKEFHLVAEPINQEFAPGMTVKAWGYNGRTPGPTIEAVEGDRVRFLVTNKLGEATSIHWHGVFLPCGMDGISGLTQPPILPGETYAYEFTLRQHGTFMYHPHADEMVQMAVGMMGMFIVHPKKPRQPRIDRDFAFMLHEWAIHPGTYRPDPSVMTEFNIFSFNGKVYPAIPPLVVRTGQRVRVRIGNLSMDEHPIHLHGYAFKVSGTDGGPVPVSAQFPETTVLVPVGATRDIEWVADVPGDWAFHCHKSHHTMGAMGHGVPNTLGADQSRASPRIRKLLPGYMPMGKDGMAEHQGHVESGHMKGPTNTLPMMAGKGPFGDIGMGGMFTIVKVRDGIADYGDPGWYQHPQGTLPYKVATPK